jgi:hypothetical protein
LFLVVSRVHRKGGSEWARPMVKSDEWPRGSSRATNEGESKAQAYHEGSTQVRHDRPLAFGGGDCFVMTTFLHVTHPARCCKEIAEVQIETRGRAGKIAPAQAIDSSHHTARGDSLQTTWKVACGGTRKKTCIHRASRKREGWRAPGKVWAWRLLIRASLPLPARTCRLGMLLHCWSSPDLYRGSH